MQHILRRRDKRWIGQLVQFTLLGSSDLESLCNPAGTRFEAQSPVKLEPCMMASVLDFRSASFFTFGVWRAGHILRENARLIFFQRLMRAARDIGRGERFDVAVLMEQVRTESVLCVSSKRTRAS